MKEPLSSLLEQIVGDSFLHARWLNTFSYLEYVGFRKIVKSQIGHLLDDETLKHAVEEGRHALLLKKQSIKFGGSFFKSYDENSMLCGKQAENYFQSLDSQCEKIIARYFQSNQKTKVTYLYVTWLIELRALHVYKAYQQQLCKQNISMPLNGLLAEEDQHLQSVEKDLLNLDPNFQKHAEKLKLIEEQLYAEYLDSLSKELSTFRMQYAHQ